MSEQENVAKDKAKHCLDRATRETGMKTPDEQLKRIFAMFPNQLDKVEDKIHELRAQAEMCEGTDCSVSSGCGLLVVKQG